MYVCMYYVRFKRRVTDLAYFRAFYKLAAVCDFDALDSRFRCCALAIVINSMLNYFHNNGEWRQHEAHKVYLE